MPANKKDMNASYCAMEHRHFATIAAIILDYPRAEGYDTQAYVTQKDMARHFVGYLSTTNPKFDRKRFLAACGVED